MIQLSGDKVSTEEACKKIILEQEEIREDLNLHRRRFDDHLKHFIKHEQEEIKRHNESIKIQHSHIKAVKELTEQTKGMKEVVEAWNAVNGAVKVGGIVGTFISWLFKLSFIGAGLMFLSEMLHKIEW